MHVVVVVAQSHRVEEGLASAADRIAQLRVHQPEAIEANRATRVSEVPAVSIHAWNMGL